VCAWICMCPLTRHTHWITPHMYNASIVHECTRHNKGTCMKHVSWCIQAGIDVMATSIYITRTSHAHHMHVTCTSHAHHMHIICTSYAHHMHVTCTSHARHMHTTRIPHAHHMHTTCTPHAHRCTIYEWHIHSTCPKYG